ncbi:MAG: alpha/beta hydrolase [bacterium]|nr:alpha/beta hydrolase [bacterium]
MMLHATNGMLTLEKHTMDYISFGTGSRNLIMLPGLGDGLKTVKGAAIPFAWMYRSFAAEYKVYVFSRINELETGYTTRDMAHDVMLAMDALGVQTASVMGVSQGGMIAQYLALDYPERIEKLVLAVTLSRQNSTVQEVIGSWIELAKNEDYKQLMIDTAEKSYSEAYLRTHRWIYPLMGMLGKPQDFSRFIIQADSCRKHNAYDRLTEMKCATLILGGRRDQIVGAQASEEMAERISNSKLYMFENYGHAAYEEAMEFNSQVRKFLSI